MKDGSLAADFTDSPRTDSRYSETRRWASLKAVSVSWRRCNLTVVTPG
jgi:hypothetical protein